jgi:hypothetical protein
LKNKFQRAKDGLAESDEAYQELTEALPASKVARWKQMEAEAAGNRDEDISAMDVYNVKTKKGNTIMCSSSYIL